MIDLRPFCLPLAAALCATASLAASPAASTDFTIGQARISIAAPGDARGDDSRRLNIVVWYPAAAGSATQPMADGPPGTPFFVEGASSRDAALVASPRTLPLIVASHGSGGTASGMGWFAAGLASRGYIVAAVDHPGNNALAPQTVSGITLSWLRASDLSRTIDAVLADPRFASRIDTTQIGAAGFSIGGNSVLELAGARADLSALHTYCTAKPQTPVCSGEASRHPGLMQDAQALALSDAAYRDALAQAGNSYRDPRVKAVFAMAPAAVPELAAASLRTIAIPVEIVAGVADPVVPVADNAVPAAAAIPGAHLDLLDPPIAHFTFVTQCAPAGTAQLAYLCADSGPVRAKAHEAAITLARAFFAAKLVR
jgi:predicted dienelactone hydrolase